MITNGHVNDNRPFFPYAMPSRLYENRPDGRLVDVSDQAGPSLGGARGSAAAWPPATSTTTAASMPLILAQNEPLAYFHNRTEQRRPLRDLPARGDEVQPRRRRGAGHRHGRRPPPGRPARRRRQLPVGQRPAAPFRLGDATASTRSRSAGRRAGSTATGPARRHGLPAPRR